MGILMAFVTLCFLSVGVSSAANKSFIFNLGGAEPQTKESQSGEKIGEMGLAWGMQSFTALSNNVHIGLDMVNSKFGDTTFVYSNVKYQFETSAVSLSGMAKYADTTVPLRPSVFAGLGLSYFSATAKGTLLPGYVWANTGTKETRTFVADSSLGYNLILGAGLEGDMGDKWFWNIAGRYTLIGVDIEDFDRTSVSALQLNMGLGFRY